MKRLVFGYTIDGALYTIYPGAERALVLLERSLYVRAPLKGMKERKHFSRSPGNICSRVAILQPGCSYRKTMPQGNARWQAVPYGSTQSNGSACQNETDADQVYSQASSKPQRQ